MSEDKMVRWQHQRNGHEFEQVQELVMNREAWRTTDRGHKKLGMAEKLN